MNSVQQKRRRCQEAPSLANGVVVGIDIGKGNLHYGAYRPDWEDGPHHADRDANGFRQLGAFIDNLKGDGFDVWVAFEPTGVYSLCLREWLVSQPYRVVQINPMHGKRIKELRDNSPEKNDDKDPGVIADVIWHGKYMNLLDIRGVYAQLRTCSALWDSLRKERSRSLNAVHSLVEMWFPELDGLLTNVVCVSGRALMRKYRTPEALGSCPFSRFEAFMRKVSRNRVKSEKSRAIWEAAKVSVAMSEGAEMHHYSLGVYLNQLEQTERAKEELTVTMVEYLTNLPSANALLTIPGIGPVTVAGILGECGDLSQYRSAGALEKAMGMNIYRISSGKFEGKRGISKRGRARARYFLCEAAGNMMKKGGVFHDYAVETAKRLGGKPLSARTRVAVARKLIRLIYAIACSCEPFDRQRLQAVTEERTGHGPASPQGTQLQAA